MCAPNARAKKEKPLYLFGIFGVGKSLHFCAVFTGVNCYYSTAPVPQGWSAAPPRFLSPLAVVALSFIGQWYGLAWEYTYTDNTGTDKKHADNTHGCTVHIYFAMACSAMIAARPVCAFCL